MKLAATLVLVTTVWASSSTSAVACGRTIQRVCHRPTTVVIQKPVVNTTIVKETVIVKPAPKPRNLLQVPQGSALRVKVNFLGNEPGYVFLKSGDITLECEVLEWTPTYTYFQLPNMGVLNPTEVAIDVAKADGRVARSINVLLIPTADIEVVESVEVVPRAPRKVSANRPILKTGGLDVSN